MTGQLAGKRDSIRRISVADQTSGRSGALRKISYEESVWLTQRMDVREHNIRPALKGSECDAVGF